MDLGFIYYFKLQSLLELFLVLKAPDNLRVEGHRELKLGLADVTVYGFLLLGLYGIDVSILLELTEFLGQF